MKTLVDDMRFDKDGYGIHQYILKLDLKTFERMSVLNPKFKPVKDGGEAEYEYCYLPADDEAVRKHLAKGKTNIG